MSDAALADAICPGLVHAQVRYKQFLRHLLHPDARWLDLGCGHEVVRHWALSPGEQQVSFTHATELSVGVDRDLSALRNNHCTPHRIAADLQSLPFADASFDVVTANMVLEHCEAPDSLMSEVWRVLRPKGVFVFHTPNKYYPMSLLAALLPDKLKSRLAARFSRRKEDDVYPTFFRLNTGAAIAHYAHRAGFCVKYSELMESLTFNPHRLIFLCNLALAWLLRRKGFRRLKPDFQVMLCKPDVECACKRLERFA